ncbi:MAG: hypothetical protein IJ930_09615 [Lachnospiraceae bacterium]|nr:hypothetical protein [Lachnospiraceae bacterium]
MKRRQTDLVPVVSEYKKLLEEIQELELKTAALAEEIDDLENHVCVELRAEYDQKIGNLEYQALAYRLEIARLKRAIELLQAAINRQEAAKYEDVQKRVEEEYKEYEEDLHKKAEEMKRDSDYAKRRAKQDQENEQRSEEVRKSKDQTESEVNEKADAGGAGTEDIHESPLEELKRLYRYIVKKLHPDVNPDITEAELELLSRAQKAYAEGDLETLREIADRLDDTELTEKYSDTLDDLARLRDLRDKLAEKVIILMEHIEKIKNSFPYNQKDFLADEEAVARKQAELTEFNKECADKIIELQNKIIELSKVAERNEQEAEQRKKKSS